MKNGIKIFLFSGVFFLLVGFFLGGFFLDFSKNTNFIEKTKEQNEINLKKVVNNTGKIIENVEDEITLEKALLNEGRFSLNNYNINEYYNYSELLISEFKKVKTIDDFKKYNEKFGTQTILFISLKLNKKDIYLKYFDFLIELEKIEAKTLKTKNELINSLKQIYDGYVNKGFYDEMGYKDEDGTYDYFRLSLMSFDYNKKLKICKEGYETEDDINSCKKYITYISATKENKYCDNFEKDHDKKWCEDTLMLIK